MLNELKVKRIGKPSRVASENLHSLLDLDPYLLGTEQRLGVRLEIPVGRPRGRLKHPSGWSLRLRSGGSNFLGAQPIALLGNSGRRTGRSHAAQTRPSAYFIGSTLVVRERSSVVLTPRNRQISASLRFNDHERLLTRPFFLFTQPRCDPLK